MSQYSVSLSLQVQQALQALKNLTGNFKKVDKEVSATTKELEKFEKELKDESATIKNTITAQTQYINKLRGIQAGLDKSSAKFKKVSAEISKFEGKLKGGVTAVQGLTGALAVLGVGATFSKITGEISKLGKEFSAAEGSVRTLTGAAKFDDVQSSISKVAQESSGLTNRIEATAASYQLLSAGVSGASNIESVLAASVDLTTAGFTDQTTAVDALTTVINAYGLEADKAALLTDQLVQTQNDGKLTINEYGQSLGKVIPTAATLGVGFGEINAAVAGITLQGNRAEIATSGLNSALNKLAAPTKEGKDILGKYGITVNAASIKADGLVGTLEKLQKVTSEQDRIKLFGTEAFKALGPLLNNFEKFKELVGNQAEATGVAQKAVDNLANAYSTLSKRNENLRTDVGVAVFEQVKPAIGAVLKVVNQLLSAFLNLPGPIKNVIIGIGVLTGLAVGIGILGISVLALKAGIVAATAQTTAWGAATVILGAAWSVVVSPITLAVLAVAALVAGAVLLYNNFEPFKNLVDAIFNELVYWGKETLAVIKAIGAFGAVMLNNYIAGWKEFFGKAGKLWSRFTDFIGVQLGKVKNRGEKTLTRITTFFSNAKTNISSIWAGLTGNVNKNTEGIGTTAKETTNSVQSVFLTVINTVRRKWSELMNSIANISIIVLGNVSDFLKAAFNIDIKTGLLNAVAAAKKEYAKAIAAGKAPIPTKGERDVNDPNDPNVPTEDQFKVGDTIGGDSPSGKAAKVAAPKTDDLKALQDKLNQAIKLDSVQDEINAAKIIGNEEGLRLNEIEKARLILMDRQKKAVDGLNTTAGKELQLQINKLELARFNKNVSTEDAILQRARADATKDVLRPLQEQKQILEGTLQGRGDEVRLQLKIKELTKGMTKDEQSKVEEIVRGNAELAKQAVKAAELKALYGQVSQRIQTGIVDGIVSAIDGTKELSQILADVLKDVGKMFLQFAVKSAFSGLGFADGGRPPTNKVSLIGEKGPELWVPDGPGTVLTNEQAFDAARSAMINTAKGDSREDAGASISAVDTAFDQNTNSITTANNLIRDREVRREETASFNSAIEKNNEATIGGGGSMIIETQVINNVEYASIDQVQKASALAIKQARAQVFSDMKNRPSIRRQIGVG